MGGKKGGREGEEINGKIIIKPEQTLFTLRTLLTRLFKCTTQAGQETECPCGEMDLKTSGTA